MLSFMHIQINIIFIYRQCLNFKPSLDTIRDLHHQEKNYFFHFQKIFFFYKS